MLVAFMGLEMSHLSMTSSIESETGSSRERSRRLAPDTSAQSIHVCGNKPGRDVQLEVLVVLASQLVRQLGHRQRGETRWCVATPTPHQRLRKRNRSA